MTRLEIVVEFFSKSTVLIIDYIGFCIPELEYPKPLFLQGWAERRKIPFARMSNADLAPYILRSPNSLYLA